MSENKLIRFDWFIKKMLRDKSDYKVLEGVLTALLKKIYTYLKVKEIRIRKIIILIEFIY